MAVNIKEYNEYTNKITYDTIPEVIGNEKYLKKALEEFKKVNMETNGFGKSGNWRHIGKIPQEVFYNYAMFKGVPVNQHMEYFSADNGKNIKKLLEEFQTFRTVDYL